MTIYELELKEIPNQTFTTTINNINMNVNVRYADDDLMLFSLQVNGEYVCPDVPVFSNQMVLPYKYMAQEAGGNFIFLTENEEYPTYQNFMKTCRLYFVTVDELYG